MKKISILIASCILAVGACNKEASKSANSTPLEISVTDMSALMQVSNTKLTSNETLDIQYTGPADSIVWWVTDSLPGNNTGDTLYTPPSIPIDSAHYPHDSTGLPPVIPPVDSTLYPPDTTIYIPPPYYDSAHHYHPADSAWKGNGLQNPFASAYTCTINNNHLVMKINLSGSYVVHVAVYHKNADGSLTLIKTGYVKVSAN